MMHTSKFLKVLSGQVETPPPIWLMRQAGRYLPEYRQLRQQNHDFMKFCRIPSLTIEATLQPIKRYDFDAAILFSDILIIPDALGQKVTFLEKKGPQLTPIASREDLRRILSFDAFKTSLDPVLDTLRGLRDALPMDKALIGFAGAPWTIFAYMVEGEGSRTFAKAVKLWYQQPDVAEELMEMICKATELYLEAQIEAGAQALQLFDSWAGAVPYPLLEKAIYAPTRRILNTLKQKHPSIPVICFPKGLGEKLPYFVETTEAKALGLDAHVDLDVLLPHFPKSLPLQGNLDPQLLIAGGPPLKNEIRRIRKCFEGRPHIFNLGHGILPETPLENVEMLVRTVREESF